MTAESWCGRAAGIDGPTWVMATYKIADCTRYIPYPIVTPSLCILPLIVACVMHML